MTAVCTEQSMASFVVLKTSVPGDFSLEDGKRRGREGETEGGGEECMYVYVCVSVRVCLLVATHELLFKVLISLLP